MTSFHEHSGKTDGEILHEIFLTFKLRLLCPYLHLEMGCTNP
jgi:hypothetical protein